MKFNLRVKTEIIENLCFSPIALVKL